MNGVSRKEGCGMSHVETEVNRGRGRGSRMSGARYVELPILSGE